MAIRGKLHRVVMLKDIKSVLKPVKKRHSKLPVFYKRTYLNASLKQNLPANFWKPMLWKEYSRINASF